MERHRAGDRFRVALSAFTSGEFPQGVVLNRRRDCPRPIETKLFVSSGALLDAVFFHNQETESFDKTYDFHYSVDSSVRIYDYIIGFTKAYQRQNDNWMDGLYFSRTLQYGPNTTYLNQSLLRIDEGVHFLCKNV